MERVVENKLIRDPYPNRTLFSKEERRPEKGTGLLSAVMADSRLNTTCELGSTTTENRRRPRVTSSSSRRQLFTLHSTKC